MNDELIHYGIKGMRWGVRKSRVSSTGTKSNTRDKKEIKAIKKEQKKWDKNVRKNGYKAYNKTIQEVNDTLIPKLNKKYEKYDFSKLDDPSIRKVYDRYIEEHDREFESIMNKNYTDMFGKRPEL